MSTISSAHAEPAHRPTSEPEQIAENVWWFRGAAPGPDSALELRYGNGGFVIGPQGVLVIDSGVSFSEGQRRLESVGRITDRPIKALVLTHAGQAFIFGATAFQAAGVPVLMHQLAARLMAGRCERCLKTLKRELGEAPMQGSQVPKADRTFSTADELNAMLPDIGIPIRLLWGQSAQSASPGACAVYIPTSGVVFAGALLDAETVPDLQDADLTSWREVREQIRRLAPRLIVPGFGPVGDARIIDALDGYLTDLQSAVQVFAQSGQPLSAVADGIDLPRYKSWDRYDSTQRRNASVLYLRREREMLSKP